MIAIAPHHWLVQPVVAFCISIGVGYCFIHSKGNARACYKDKAISSHTFFFYPLSSGNWRVKYLKDMADGPSLLQRQAIGNMIATITKDSPTVWGNYLWEQLEGWNIIANSDISLPAYYYELKHIPDWPKRSIVYTILMSWNYHHDLQTLYQAINKLIYLKVCNATEYFLMQYMFNFLQYFSTVCKNVNTIQIEQNMFNRDMFTLRFWKDISHSETYGIVEFQFSSIGKEPRIAIVPWFSLIGEKTNHRYNFYTQNGIDDLVNCEFVPLLQKEFAKKHCPWIYSNLRFGYQKENLDRGIVILLSSLEYEDRNGGL